MLSKQRSRYLLHLLHRLDIMGDKHVLLYNFLPKRSPKRHMYIKINPSNVPMEMIRNSPLRWIDKPVARAVELVAEVIHHHDNICELQSCQLLNVAIWPCVDDHGPAPVVTEKDGELVLVSNSLRQLEPQSPLTFRMIREPLCLPL